MKVDEDIKFFLLNYQIQRLTQVDVILPPKPVEVYNFYIDEKKKSWFDNLNS